MTTQGQTVFVVDDEMTVRNSLKWLLESVKIPVETFESGQSFLIAYHEEMRGCLVLDIRMPQLSGLELMKRLRSQDIQMPIIFLSAHGDIPMAVQALKDGAFDFLEKPYNNQKFLDCVQNALEYESVNQVRKNADDDLTTRLENLTPRERDIINLVVSGKSNKEIAKTLNISHKTVEAHRGRLMLKMGVNNVIDLVRLMTTHYTANHPGNCETSYKP